MIAGKGLTLPWWLGERLREALVFFTSLSRLSWLMKLISKIVDLDVLAIPERIFRIIAHQWDYNYKLLV